MGTIINHNCNVVASMKYLVFKICSYLYIYKKKMSSQFSMILFSLNHVVLPIDVLRNYKLKCFNVFRKSFIITKYLLRVFFNGIFTYLSSFMSNESAYNV